MLFGKLRKNLKKFDPEKERQFRDELEENGGLEKNDLKALIVSAMVVIMPVAIILLLVMALFAALMFH